jgi:hypothetical protein
VKTGKLQTNFTAGEITPELGARTDLQVYSNGASRIRNCRPLPGGGLRRRGGLAWAATLEPGPYQHESWIFNFAQSYQLLFSTGRVDIHDGVDGLLLQSIIGPWLPDMVGKLSVHTEGDFAFIAHPLLRTVQLKRTGAASFTLEYFVFDRLVSGEEVPIFQPYHRFQRPDVTISVLATSAGYSNDGGWTPGTTATLTTAIDVFSDDYVGTYLTICGAQFEITGFTDLRTVSAVLRSDHFRVPLTDNPITFKVGSGYGIMYDPSHDFVAGDFLVIVNAIPFAGAAYASTNGLKVVVAPTASTWDFDLGGAASASAVGGGPSVQYWSSKVRTVDWKEQMYSAVHGWPHGVGGWQSRLVVFGGLETPNRLNFSRVEAPFNYDPGSGLDDEAILVGVSGRRTPTIRSLVGSDHLQIFTSEGEYYIPRSDIAQALTPTTIAILPQTFYGTREGVPAVEFDGATLFVTRNGQHLRQLVWAERGYTAPDLSYLADHLITDPVWLAVQMEDAFNGAATALVVNADGTVAVLTMVRSEKVAAWSLHSTAGALRTACAVDNRAFVVTERTIAGEPVTWLEKIGIDRLLDGSAMGSYVGPDGYHYIWEGFERFAGQPISLVVDGLADIGLHTPDANGRVTILARAETLEGGLGFVPLVRTLTPEVVLPNGPSPGEMRRVVLANSEVVNTLGMTVNGQLIAQMRSEDDLGEPARPFSGRIDSWLFGWDDKGQVTYSQIANAPFTLLSVNLSLEF